MEHLKSIIQRCAQGIGILSDEYQRWVVCTQYGIYPAILDCRVIDLRYMIAIHNNQFQYELQPVLEQYTGDSHNLMGFGVNGVQELRQKHSSYQVEFSKQDAQQYHAQVMSQFHQLIELDNQKVAKRKPKPYYLMDETF